MATRATPEVTANDAVALLVEVAALVLLGVWGYAAGTDPLDRLLLAVGVPSAAIVLWALFAAPKAVHDGPGARLTVKVVVLGGAVLAGFAVLPRGWAGVRGCRRGQHGPAPRLPLRAQVRPSKDRPLSPRGRPRCAVVTRRRCGGS